MKYLRHGDICQKANWKIHETDIGGANTHPRASKLLSNWGSSGRADHLRLNMVEAGQWTEDVGLAM